MLETAWSGDRRTLRTLPPRPGAPHSWPRRKPSSRRPAELRDEAVECPAGIVTYSAQSLQGGNSSDNLSQRSDAARGAYRQRATTIRRAPCSCVFIGDFAGRVLLSRRRSAGRREQAAWNLLQRSQASIFAVPIDDWADFIAADGDTELGVAIAQLDSRESFCPTAGLAMLSASNSCSVSAHRGQKRRRRAGGARSGNHHPPARTTCNRAHRWSTPSTALAATSG